jgi:hypothetical protein
MLGGDARGWKMNPRKKKAPFSSNFGRVFCELRVQEPVSGSSWRIKGKATFRKQIVDTKGKCKGKVKDKEEDRISVQLILY